MADDSIFPACWGDWSEEQCTSLLCGYAIHISCLEKSMNAKAVADMFDFECPVCRRVGRYLQTLQPAFLSASPAQMHELHASQEGSPSLVPSLSTHALLFPSAASESQAPALQGQEQQAPQEGSASLVPSQLADALPFLHAASESQAGVLQDQPASPPFLEMQQLHASQGGSMSLVPSASNALVLPDQHGGDQAESSLSSPCTPVQPPQLSLTHRKPKHVLAYAP